jgi:hypothetical protein
MGNRVNEEPFACKFVKQKVRYVVTKVGSVSDGFVKPAGYDAFISNRKVCSIDFRRLMLTH